MFYVDDGVQSAGSGRIRTQKIPSLAAQHGPLMPLDALLKPYAPFTSGLSSVVKRHFYFASGAHQILQITRNPV